MSKLRIAPINFFDDASLAVSPAMLTTMPATNAQLTARDLVARSSSNAAQEISGNWGGEMRKINCAFIFRHNGQGGSVRLQLYSDVAYATQIYDSGTVQLYSIIDSGLDVGYEVGSPESSSDILGADAPWWKYLDATYTAKSFKLTFQNCARSYWEFGRIWLGKYVEAPYSPKYGMSLGRASNAEQSRTRGGSLRTTFGEAWRVLRIDMFYATDADRAIWSDIEGLILDTSDVAISVYPNAGGRQERDHVLNAQLTSLSPFNISAPAFHEKQYEFTEV